MAQGTRLAGSVWEQEGLRGEPSEQVPTRAPRGHHPSVGGRRGSAALGTSVGTWPSKRGEEEEEEEEEAQARCHIAALQRDWGQCGRLLAPRQSDQMIGRGLIDFVSAPQRQPRVMTSLSLRKTRLEIGEEPRRRVQALYSNIDNSIH